MDDSLEEIEEIKSYCQNVQEIQEYTLMMRLPRTTKLFLFSRYK